MKHFLYIMHERDWREQSFKSSYGREFDHEMCLLADMVIAFSDGKFTIVKNRYGNNDITVDQPAPRYHHNIADKACGGCGHCKLCGYD